MLNWKEAFDRLNKEKEYEDALVERLDRYFLSILGDIPDLTVHERKKIEEHLVHIMRESEEHSYLFNSLMQILVEDEPGHEY